MQYDQLYAFVISKLENELDSNITYHNVRHTINVIKNATYIAEKENYDENQVILLKTAALLHDVGFLENSLNHEVLGCNFAKKHLKSFDYSDAEVIQICEMIMATKLPQTPKNELSKMLCDADLFYLGDENFTSNAEKLFTELQHFGFIKTKQEWNDRQLDFLKQHSFFTKTAKLEQEAQKQKNFKSIKDEIELTKPKKKHIKEFFKDLFFIVLGVLFTSFALTSFLLPNKFFDGGVTGLSLLIHGIYDVNLQTTIIIINIPLIIISYFSVGKRFAIRTFLSILLLSVCLWLLPSYVVTEDKLIISIFGGVFLGIGIGLAMRAGAALDGIEVLAIYTLKKTSFSITEIVLGINIIIFGVAAFQFGVENSLYSILTYFVATRTIDYVVEGIQAFTGVTIISSKSETIKYQLVNELGRGITIYKGERGFLPGKFDVSVDCDIIYTVITRLEMRKLKNLVYEIDPNAFIFANTIRETSGGIIKNKIKH